MIRVAKKEPEYIDGLTRLAAAICHRYKISCTRQGVKRWQSWPDPFPAPKESNRYNRRDCFEWVEQHIMTKRKTSGQVEEQTIFQEAAEAEARQKIREDEEHKFEFDITKGKYIERALAQRTTIGVIKKHHSLVRSELERALTSERRDKLTTLGVTPETVAAFYEFDIELARAAIDRIEERCQQEAKENL